MSEPTIGIQLGNANSSSKLGTGVLLQTREGSKQQDMLLTSPLSIEINVDNNNYPSDEIKFTSGSGDKKKVLAILDQNGNLRIRGKVIPDSNFD